ncbi:AAA family ATPase [Salinimonas marina]|uniref:AAA family ATPase n=1 Tax=Salinimonas marina TaxID=2785918 RepID=A0A7S9DXV3_9ALTE|nr:AAA family ATPase [Salinimonas marina]QPG05981.1 AAA family ATPase [Salinimonas marina]
MHPLYLVTGQPAVGKTTYAQKLAQSKHACLIDIDTISEPIVQAGLSLAGMPVDDRDSQTYKQAFREPVYDAMWQTARQNLPQVPVVMCGPFTRELRQPDWQQQIQQNMQCPVTIYWLYASIATIKMRMQKRGNKRDWDKLAGWEAYQTYFKAMPQCRHIAVNCDT